MAFRQVRNDLIGSYGNAPDANVEFRKQCQAVHDALASSGWIQTADTGQANLTTINGPPGADQYPGFEIWRMADALQATSPIFFKLQYGAGGGTSFVVFAVRIQIGNGSNGSGGLLGNLSVLTRVSTIQSSTTGDWNQAHVWLFSGDTDRFLMAFNFDGPTSTSPLRAWFFSIERAVNANGVRTGGCYLSAYSTRDADRQEYIHPFLGGVGQELEMGILASRVGQGLSGKDISVFPQYLSYFTFLPAGLSQFGAFSSAVPTHSEIVIPVYGTNHTYYALGSKFAGDSLTNASISKGDVRNNNIGVSLLVRYDP